MAAVMAVVGAYLLGSVSFAWLLARARGVDLRQVGSGNLGATNAGRALGWWAFVLVFLLDLAKGWLPVVVAGTWLGTSTAFGPWLTVAVAAAAVLGHVFTCFHGLRGGKAVATSLGVVIALAPWVALVGAVTFALVWGLQRALFRFSASKAVGLASVCAAIAVVPARLFLAPAPFAGTHAPVTALLLVLATIIVVRHRGNLAALVGRAPARIEQRG